MICFVYIVSFNGSGAIWILVAKSKMMLFSILNAFILSVKMDFATRINLGAMKSLWKDPVSAMCWVGRLGKPFNYPVLATWAICSEKGVYEQYSLSSCKSKSSQIVEIRRAQGTLLFCPNYPFKSQSNSFGNAIHLHKAHAFERERCPFWERFYFASTLALEFE